MEDRSRKIALFIIPAFLAKFPVNLAVAAFGAYPNDLLSPVGFLEMGLLGLVGLGLMRWSGRPWLVVGVLSTVGVAYVAKLVVDDLDVIQAHHLHSYQFWRDWIALLLMYGAFFPTVALIAQSLGSLPSASKASRPGSVTN